MPTQRLHHKFQEHQGGLRAPPHFMNNITDLAAAAVKPATVSSKPLSSSAGLSSKSLAKALASPDETSKSSLSGEQGLPHFDKSAGEQVEDILSHMQRAQDHKETGKEHSSSDTFYISAASDTKAQNGGREAGQRNRP